MYGHLWRDEEDLMFQMEATEDEEVSRRPESCNTSGCVCCQEAAPDQGPGKTTATVKLGPILGRNFVNFSPYSVA